MIRIMAVVASSLLMAGCAAGGASVKPAPEGRRTGEWQQLPQEAGNPSGLALQNARTKAVVSITFIAAGRTPRDLAESLALRLAADGADVDDLKVLPDGQRADFAWSANNAGHQVRGRAVVKSLGQPKPLVIAVGVWPIQYDEEMARDFEEIVNGVSVR